jgi:hypothetical protein
VRANAIRFGLAGYVVEPQAGMEADIVTAVRRLASCMSQERAALAAMLPQLRQQAQIPFATIARMLGRGNGSSTSSGDRLAGSVPPKQVPRLSAREALRPEGS